ncbi:MAG: ABC transporter permease [Actinobacteria bacterium]|nr:ABC transporter permease [Candidatus Planktophila sp.]PHX67125.1 MAG: ABC transporter permease [Actinomycetota bacterium]
MSAMKILRYATMLIFVLASIRIITGASDLTSTGTASAALLLSVPIILAALGGLFSERAGVVNIGLEGMMIMGAWAGGFIGAKHGPWLGLVAAIIFGSVGALVHAVATVGFGVDHVVSGVAINIIAAGLARYLSTILYQSGTWLGPSQSPDVEPIPLNGLPLLSGGQYFGWKSPDLLGTLAERNWFFISDFAAVLRGLTGDLSYVTMVVVAFVPLAYFILWKTTFGLRLRSAGEAPIAAESLGVNVYAMKYAGVLISGGLAGLGGGFLAIVAANHYQENQVSGRGYIGLAALIFGNYRPGGLLAGAGLFGFADALQLRDSAAIRALILFVVLILVFAAFRSFKKGNQLNAALSLASAALSLWIFFTVAELPGQLVTMTPYIATILVMALASQRLRMPAADGMPYRRGGLR